MKRGEIYFANLDPCIGEEIKKMRPVLIISNNANNRKAGTVTVIPITSNVKKVYPFEVLLEQSDSKLARRSKVQCHQIRTLSKIRFSGACKGEVNSVKLLEIENALKLHLGFL